MTTGGGKAARGGFCTKFVIRVTSETTTVGGKRARGGFLNILSLDTTKKALKGSDFHEYYDPKFQKSFKRQ